MKRRIVLFVLLALDVYHVQGREIHAGGSGASDSNPGTAAQPYATIQKAASVAVAGDVVKIRTGVYRETITPANSGSGENPITYQADNGASVVVSGLNVIGNDGWTVHSGNIFKKSVTLPVDGYNRSFGTNTTLAANQIFKAGVMQIEARWPKAGSVEELFQRTNLRQRNFTSNWTQTQIIDNGIPDIAGGWAGGKIFITGWFIAHTTSITSHSGNRIGFSSPFGDLRFAQYYYLTGRLGALTQAKEWHYENNTLYLWQKGGGAPTDIEYKARNWGFDLSGKNNIVITGIQLVGCEVNGDTSTSNITLDNIRAKYFNHAVMAEGRGDLIYGNAHQTGFKLMGSNNVVKNSEFQYCASQGIWLGEGGRIENNKFSYISYEGNYGAPVTFNGKTGNQKILNNTFSEVGRSAIDFGTIENGQHLNVEIAYNDIYAFGMLSADGGGIYAARYQNLCGTKVHHNWIHNSKAVHTPSTGFDVGINAGIYYDQATGSGTTNHHNVLWDNGQADLHVSTANAGDPANRNNPPLARGKAFFYNNTCVTKVHEDYVHGYFSYLNTATQYYDVMRNNIFRARNMQGDFVEVVNNGQSPFDMQNCLGRGVDPQFAGGSAANPTAVANPENYFQIQAGSPARNAGVVIAGITDGSIGVPDIGAYEYGGEKWIPGYRSAATAPSVNTRSRSFQE